MEPPLALTPCDSRTNEFLLVLIISFSECFGILLLYSQWIVFSVPFLTSNFQNVPVASPGNQMSHIFIKLRCFCGFVPKSLSNFCSAGKKKKSPQVQCAHLNKAIASSQKNNMKEILLKRRDPMSSE